MAARPLIADLIDGGGEAAPAGFQIVALALAAAGTLLSGAVLWGIAGPVAALAFVGGVALAVGAAAFLFARGGGGRETRVESDWALVRAAAGDGAGAFAVTDRDGRVRASNGRYRGLFGHRHPVEGAEAEATAILLERAAREAMREGAARIGELQQGGIDHAVTIERSGRAGDSLVWRFVAAGAVDLVEDAQAMLSGIAGDRLGEAGLMGALLVGGGRIKAANRVFRLRATGRGDAVVNGRDLGAFLALDAEGRVRFSCEGNGAGTLRLIQVPLDPAEADGPLIVLLLDEDGLPAAAGGGRGRGRDVARHAAVRPGTGRSRRSFPVPEQCLRARRRPG